MRLFSIIILPALMISAHADEKCNLQLLGIAQSDIQVLTQIFGHVVDASFKIKDNLVSKDPNEGRCSAVYISNDGNALTAQHCLKNCIQASGYMTKNGGDLKENYTCEILLNGKKASITLLATSSCIPSTDLIHEKNTVKKLWHNIIKCEESLDYAVFKVLNKNSLCVKTASNVNKESVVYSASFPAPKKYSNVEFVDGNSLTCPS